MGGRNINDLTSTSDDILSSDTSNRSPQRQMPHSPQRQVAWSKGMENLVKATSAQTANSNAERFVVADTGHRLSRVEAL